MEKEMYGIWKIDLYFKIAPESFDSKLNKM